jgi:hypothetical protein
LAGIEQDVLYRPVCFINAQTSHTIKCQGQKSAATSSSQAYVLDERTAMAPSDEKTSMLGADANPLLSELK